MIKYSRGMLHSALWNTIFVENCIKLKDDFSSVYRGV